VDSHMMVCACSHLVHIHDAEEDDRCRECSCDQPNPIAEVVHERSLRGDDALHVKLSVRSFDG